MEPTNTPPAQPPKVADVTDVATGELTTEPIPTGNSGPVLSAQEPTDEAVAVETDDSLNLDAGEPAPMFQAPPIVDTDEPDETPRDSEPQVANAVQKFQTSVSRDTGSPDNIAIPPASMDLIQDRLEKMPNLDMVVSNNQYHWAEVLRQSLSNTPMENMYNKRLNEPEAKFRQDVEYNGASLRGRPPAYKKKPGETVVEGESALLQLMSHLGIGTLFRAPLWNSGIWVTFKPATETELLELNRIIQSDKIMAGRWSYGLALSNNVSYTLDRVFDFVLAHVYNTSIRSDELPISKLRDWIAPQDINSFIWGYLCANYPSGFHYETSCIKDPSKCNHVMAETLNVTKLQWTDTSILSDWQKQHMSSMAANSRSLDSLKRYREEMERLQPRRILLNEGTKHEMAFTIKTPTITDYIDQGHRWIGGMVESVNRVIGLDGDDKTRNNMINELNKATTLCQYSHWIESIESGELSTTKDGQEEQSIVKIVDRASIEENLKALSAIDSIRETMIDKILEYIDHSTISIIGVPAYECPVCSAEYNGNPSYPRHVNIVPLDLLQVFFALLGRRLSRIETRSDR